MSGTDQDAHGSPAAGRPASRSPGLVKPQSLPADFPLAPLEEDPSIHIAFGPAVPPHQAGEWTGTATQRPPRSAAAQAQRDRERLLALQLLDLEWTSLSREMQQAVVALLHAVTTGREG